MATAEIETPQIYGIITKIKKAAGALGKEKTSGINFPFRGIDGTVNHLAQHIEAEGVVTVPKILNHEVTTREDGKGRIIKTSKVEVEYTFYAPDGSYVRATTGGLADDFADRSTAQAQSVAFRIALLQTFFLPTQAPEPEVTGGLVEQKASPVQQKLEKARQATTPAKSTSATSRDKVRTDWIEAGKVDKDAVNGLVASVKAEKPDLKGDAVFEEVLERLSKGDLG